MMEIDVVRNNFSRFYDGVELIVKDEGTKIVCDIQKKELVPLAHTLLNLAYDLLAKYGSENCDSVNGKIVEALTIIDNGI